MSISARRSPSNRPSWWRSHWRISVPGWAFMKDPDSSGMTMGASVTRQPTDSAPRSWPASNVTEYRLSACLISSLASRNSVRPAGVSDSPWAWWRMKSWIPSSCSRCEMAVEMEGWEIFARSEASVMLPVSPAAMKYSSWRSVNFNRGSWGVQGSVLIPRPVTTDPTPLPCQDGGDPAAVSGVARNVVGGGGGGLAGALDVGIDLGGVDIPGGLESGKGIG